MKLADETYGQALMMTITKGPGVNAEECGHWYSPAAVAQFLADKESALIADQEAGETGYFAEEFASRLDLAKLPLVVPNQYEMHPVQAVPSDPSIISNGGELTTVSS